MKGSCLCGKVRIQIDGEFDYAGYCHCSECQKFSGSATGAFGGLKKDKLTVVQGFDDIQHYQKTENSRLGFCRHCGSSLYSEKVHWDTINIRLGIIDGPISSEPDFHVYVGSKAVWDHCDDGAPKFEELPS